MDITILTNIMVILFGVILVGFIITKIGILDTEKSAMLSELVIKVTLPSLIIGSVFSGGHDMEKSVVVHMLVMGFVYYLILFLLSILIVFLIKPDIRDKGLYQVLTVFVNNGFIGYPLFHALFGPASVFFASIIHLPYNLFFFTAGVHMLRGENEPIENKKSMLKKLISPGTLASVLAITIFLLDINPPEPVKEVLKILGSATTPLGLLIIGSTLASIPMRSMFKNTRLLMFSAYKLLLVPALMFLSLSFFELDPLLRSLLIISAALPSGSLVVMMASQLKANQGLASSAVFITTLLSLITMPIIAYLFIV